ncbi:DUF1848 domain-containing protein [Clostridium sporogenes]|uniref:DUF1848 domain-containing protein n=3 Tax=Clostridium sporogenes TaxID=1509 RepID=UPI0013D8901F|nr:DUF1848 domain-containing protein [Clostridium sporogenes]NFF79482.1 DUF1848 domain-containing protein [Clostridium sporogenes]NFL79673.1 DUF1848 domain-containing protein [Clostridium sporogenes]NFU39279.1 DUF1848 domain-containing protein [Clostridium sporogenes]NFU79186.1 DUF1848 domain-containing protein [Clostridium sporogenes]
MILSVSRRTDIPAFYSEWFFNRIKEGVVLVRNPFNAKQISRINLSPKVIDCIVFWTKNPKEMIKRLDEIKEYNYYFQFTLSSYDKNLEKNVPEKKYLINTFIELSQKIGKDKVIWRYDPIILTDKFTKEYHYKWFDYLAKRLSPYTNKCVISFLDLYKKTERNLKKINILPLNKDDMIDLADKFSKIASKYNLIIETCSEEIELSKFNINHGKCIDDKLISHITGEKLSIDKDPNQRETCACVKSIDIGAYNTCNHDCLYCYANFNREIVKKNMLKHNQKSPLLFGDLYGEEQIIDRKMKSYRVGQISFL